ncbi:C-type lectin domain family 4 member E-like [Chanos chanos]|uniref:C-type lectin domain family 4 member E-like n=1 Tax=Chanos chanos TaxID=29144 RepID=A0A6J2WJP9_CHACN|nr:C-type lectin domain family 4 member E-like [Chanos chanos]
MGGHTGVTRITLALSTRILQNKYIKEGWRYLSPSLYYTSPVEKTWSESRQDCIERGADLVIINSKEEQDFVGMLIRTRDIVGAWIGLTDHVTEDVWKWVDGTALTTGYWRKGEPSQYGSVKEDCATVRSDAQPYENWNDMGCSQTSNWICEKKIVF